MSRLLVFLLLVNLYVLVLYLLYKKGRLGKDVDLVLGFILMWKTQRGKAAIDRIARSRRLWERFGDVSIGLTLLAAGAMLLLLVVQVFIFASQPRQVAANTPGAEYLVGLPGLNPAIPIGYGILGLVIALVVHEGAHGVLARVADIKVRSLGLLFAVVPIGAFVEPDEEETERATTRRKMRIFAAGPGSNLILAFVAALLFSGVVMSASTYEAPTEGVFVLSVAPDTPAARAGLTQADVVTLLNTRPVTGVQDFSRRLDNFTAGQTIVLVAERPGEGPRTFTVTLGDRHAYYAANGITPNPDSNRGKPFLGVSFASPAFPHAYHGVLQSPAQSLAAFGVFVYHPFYSLFQFDPLNDPYNGWVEVHGPLASLPREGFFLLANSLYWIFWLNLMLGTFNALPMGPLDGGHMFKAGLRSHLYRRFGIDRSQLVIEKGPLGPGLTVRGADAETQAKLERVAGVMKRATWGVGLTILGMVLLPLVAAPFINALG